MAGSLALYNYLRKHRVNITPNCTSPSFMVATVNEPVHLDLENRQIPLEQRARGYETTDDLGLLCVFETRTPRVAKLEHGNAGQADEASKRLTTRGFERTSWR